MCCKHFIFVIFSQGTFHESLDQTVGSGHTDFTNSLENSSELSAAISLDDGFTITEQLSNITVDQDSLSTSENLTNFQVNNKMHKLLS